MNRLLLTIAGLILTSYWVSAADVQAQAPNANTINVQSQPSTAPLPPSGHTRMAIPVGFLHACGPDEYPPEARRDRIEGSVMLAFTITSDGAVSDIRVSKSSGSDLLDAAAVKCASNWRYQPALRYGQPVAIPWSAVVNWALGASSLGDVSGFGVCVGILSSAQSAGLIPFYGRLTSETPQAGDRQDRYVCTAATRSTKYTVTADMTCPNIAELECISLVSVVSDDGTVLYKKPD